MDISKFLKQSSLYNVLAVESLFGEDFRKRLSLISKLIILTVFIAFLFYYATKNFVRFSDYRSFIENYSLIQRGIGLILFNVAVFLWSQLTDFYLSSTYYFEKITKNKYSEKEKYTFSAGRILYAGRNTDILHGFLSSKIGKMILTRLGVKDKDIKTFYNSVNIIKNEHFPLTENKVLKILDIARFLYAYKPEFAKFLNDRSITEKEFLGAIEWVIYEIETIEYNSEWWRPEALAKTKSIASDWSFGQTFVLDKYSRNIINDQEVNSEAVSFANREMEIGQIENSISKSTGANVMLVGEPGQEKMQVIWSLGRNIKNKTASESIKNKKLVMLLSNSISATCRDKDSLEDQTKRILMEVTKAGNIILVIDNFTEMYRHADSLGVDFVNLLDPFISNTNLQLIALVNTADYHHHFAPNKVLMNNFETVLVRPLNTEEIIKIIYAAALFSEKTYKIFFTYQAVQELAKSASYYFSTGVTTDKAVDLLNEIAPWAKRKGKKIINKDDVLEYVEQKTNIPTSGKISEDEKKKLLNLEEHISKRVIGQKDAILAVSGSLRRARTGVRNPNKPIGSFLFLGPTGVGKTETAKALAHTFFGSENNMMRLDMSEYQTEDAMERLIGSYTSGKPGVFASMLREKPFGVVLLDEFEKTNKDVLNLFLQILDEGFFSDSAGQKVNTRNIIFIATSNAGAETIFKMVNEGKNPKDAHDEIISEIVSRGLFRPELINRFDSTIIFKPLEHDDLVQIAKIMMKKVSNRMLEKGLTINTGDDVIEYIIENGSNKAFGARPMNRFIQDSVEAQIANLILKGDAVAGKTIKFATSNNSLSAEIL
jgi:ATP-dependent Clp protease ATP-binding subunit ClpC